MAYTSDDLLAVNTAIYNLMAGDRIVRLQKGDQLTEFSPANMGELRQLRAEIISGINSSSGRGRFFRASTSKGL